MTRGVWTMTRGVWRMTRVTSNAVKALLVTAEVTSSKR